MSTCLNLASLTVPVVPVVMLCKRHVTSSWTVLFLLKRGSPCFTSWRWPTYKETLLPGKGNWTLTPLFSQVTRIRSPGISYCNPPWTSLYIAELYYNNGARRWLKDRYISGSLRRRAIFYSVFQPLQFFESIYRNVLHICRFIFI